VRVAESDELTLMIAQHLELDHQYVERVEAWDAEHIAELRSAGRKAGRLLGWKIITHQTPPNDEGRVVVVVCLRESPNEEEDLRMQARTRLLLEQIFKDPTEPPGEPG
jgi:hypothetical protein